MCHHARHHHHREAGRPAEDTLRDEPSLRASDEERETTVTLLREHGATGRLDVDELEQRIGAAYQARTRGELATLLDDLPRIAGRARAAPGPHAGPPPADHGWGIFMRVTVLLVVIWALSGAGYFWPIWVIAWWGIALTMRSAPRLLRLR